MLLSNEGISSVLLGLSCFQSGSRLGQLLCSLLLRSDCIRLRLKRSVKRIAGFLVRRILLFSFNSGVIRSLSLIQLQIVSGNSVRDRLPASLSRFGKSFRICRLCISLCLCNCGIRLAIFTITESAGCGYCLSVFGVKSGNLLAVFGLCIRNSLRIDGGVLPQLASPFREGLSDRLRIFSLRSRYCFLILRLNIFQIGISNGEKRFRLS